METNNEASQAREGPVQFEKDTDDPFNIDEMINEVKGKKTGEKRYGLNPGAEEQERKSKRARIDSDSE
jgi:SNW domain-containing protein 1